MMGRMYKRINVLENRDLFDIEKKEHNLKRTPTVGQLLRIEMQEHKLKNLPTLAQVKRAEAKEHAEDDDNEYERESNGNGVEDLIIEGTTRNRNAANRIYRRAK